MTLGYDPALRLYQVAGAATTRFAYDGVNAIAEYDGSNALQRRYVFGPGLDEPIVWYEGTGTTDRRFMSSDERGSIISLTDSSGALIAVNRYDEYGKPQSTNLGRFQYTGQMWLSEIGAYYYKARVYLPHLGIFAQTDPIGYRAGANIYAYVLNDPGNLVDPLGLQQDTGITVSTCRYGGSPGHCVGPPQPGWENRDVSSKSPGERSGPDSSGDEIVITAKRPPPPPPPPEDTIFVTAPHILQPAPPAGPPIVLAAAAPKQDYCGAEGSEWVPDIGPGATDISGACKAHDACYSPVSSTDRLTCDKNLAWDIMRSCWVFPVQCTEQAEIYYLAVRRRGLTWYRGSGDPR